MPETIITPLAGVKAMESTNVGKLVAGRVWVTAMESGIIVKIFADNKIAAVFSDVIEAPCYRSMTVYVENSKAATLARDIVAKINAGGVYNGQTRDGKFYRLLNSGKGKNPKPITFDAAKVAKVKAAKVKPVAVVTETVTEPAS